MYAQGSVCGPATRTEEETINLMDGVELIHQAGDTPEEWQCGTPKSVSEMQNVNKMAGQRVNCAKCLKKLFPLEYKTPIERMKDNVNNR